MTSNGFQENANIPNAPQHLPLECAAGDMQGESHAKQHKDNEFVDICFADPQPNTTYTGNCYVNSLDTVFLSPVVHARTRTTQYFE